MGQGTVTRQSQCAEAVCAGLYNLQFEALGNSHEGRIDWFHRGHHPKDIRVNVARALTFDGVVVEFEWRNFASGAAIKGSETFTIPTDGGVDMQGIHDAVLACLERALTIFKDVLEGTGVAGKQGLEASAPAHLDTEDTDG